MWQGNTNLCNKAKFSWFLCSSHSFTHGLKFTRVERISHIFWSVEYISCFKWLHLILLNWKTFSDLHRFSFFWIFFISGVFKCSKCFKTYRRKTSLYSHRRWECGKEPQFKCAFCPHRGKQKIHILMHISAKHKEYSNAMLNKYWILCILLCVAMYHSSSFNK